MLKLDINQEMVSRARKAAFQITNAFSWLFEGYTTVTTERTVLRLMGIDGALKDGKPLPNVVVDHLVENSAIQKGAAIWVANAMLKKGLTAQQVAEEVACKGLELTQISLASGEEILNTLNPLVEKMLGHITAQKQKREELLAEYQQRPKPVIYVIVATGNIYEDVIQARAAAREGADAIAVIRSTAQSLLDYVPFGATTVGFGGTFATQENFKIMRKALDEVAREKGHYIYLTNYASGLCMPEISAMGAMERLDMMLNDAMYGILFRDINPKRTLLDQYFPRMINAYAGIEIQTGEDNYLTTSDAVEKAYTVTASQLINESFAVLSGVKPEKMGLGHAFEINPELENSFSYELAHALLTKTLFPDSPVKYMPPTKFASGNIFHTYLLNAMFNFIGQLTEQGVQLLGMMTEAIHTPHLADRYLAIENAQYIFKAVKDLNQNLCLAEDSFINRRANEVLVQATEFLEKVAREGLFSAMAKGEFAEIKRSENGGKGLEGVIMKDKDYYNPFMESMKQELKL